MQNIKIDHVIPYCKSNIYDVLNFILLINII